MIGFSRVDRYLAGELFRGYAQVALVLLALFSLLALLEELENVGDSAYGMLDALAYVGMTTPARVLRLLPFVTLLGSALALWQLARRSELVVLRAAGMGLPRFALAATLPSLVLVLVIPLIYEFLAPALYRDATLSRDLAMGRADIVASDGFWSRRGDTLIEVDRFEHGRVATGVRIYQLAPGAELDEIVLADSADPDGEGAWRFGDAQRRSYALDEVVRESARGQIWRPWWADQQHLRVPPVDSLSFTDLRGYIAYLERTEQPTARWELAYWRMWLLPLTALLTGLLAVPIALSSDRQAEIGKVALALGAGVVYYLGDQILANAGMVAGASPLAVAAVPPMVLALVVALVLRRVV